MQRCILSNRTNTVDQTWLQNKSNLTKCIDIAHGTEPVLVHIQHQITSSGNVPESINVSTQKTSYDELEKYTTAEIQNEVDHLQLALSDIALSAEEEPIATDSQQDSSVVDASAVIPCNEEEEEQVEAEEDPACPATLEEMVASVERTVDELRALGIPVAPSSALALGKELGRGAFGTVRLGTLDLAGSGLPTPVAVKTVIAAAADFHERLRAFRTEAAVGWAASRGRCWLIRRRASRRRAVRYRASRHSSNSGPLIERGGRSALRYPIPGQSTLRCAVDTR